MDMIDLQSWHLLGALGLAAAIGMAGWFLYGWLYHLRHRAPDPPVDERRHQENAPH